MEIAEITQGADMKARVFFIGQRGSGDEGETGDDQYEGGRRRPDMI